MRSHLAPAGSTPTSHLRVRRTARRPLDVAIAGTRGVPARYGGFETFAEELGRRLAERDHRVTVYGRVPYVGPERRTYLGMHVVPVAAPRGKHVETPLHGLLTALVALRASHDIVLLCNGANAFALPLFRFGGARVAINVDGVERLRRKWGRLGKLWYLLGERLSLLLADRPVADARVIGDYYLRRYGRALDVIPYGGDRIGAPGEADPASLRRFGLEPGRYVLVVGRLEPENNALLVVRAYRRVRSGLPLVVVGDAPYADRYKRQLRAAADPRVVFTGAVYGLDYLALQAHAACYVAAGEVGGTHPTLVEAMSFGAPVVANDVPEHREVLSSGGLYYPHRDEARLAAAIERVLSDPGLAANLQRRARRRAARCYRWDDVTRRYEQLFYAMLEGVDGT
jgi:glycosyltransferase involved in cell wall biosynthesis